MPSASKMRSEPEAWSARVITARPPAFSTAAAMASSSVATTTGPTPAASARRSTCTIIGSPAMSASGLPGSRVDGHAGGDQDQDVVGHRLQSLGIARRDRRAKHQADRGCALRYTGCQRRGKPGICAPPRRAAVQPDVASFSGSRSAMDSFELNKVLGAVLGTCLALLSLNIAAGALFTSHVPEKPGYEIAVQEQPAAGGHAAGAGRGSADRAAGWPAPMSHAARRPPRNAPPATPSTRAARTASAPISGASSAVQRRSRGGLQLLRRR